MKIESRYKLGIVKNGLPYFGEVNLKIELLLDSKEHEIVEMYGETRFSEGYFSWKKGIKNGVDYGLSKINDDRKFKVSIFSALAISYS